MTLCIDNTQSSASREGLLDALVNSLRGRVDQNAVRVLRCDGLRAAPTWRVAVEAAEAADELKLVITGDGRRIEMWLPVQGLDPYTLAQVLALNAAEAVRPGINALLARLGLGASDALTNTEGPPAPVVAQVARAKPVTMRQWGALSLQLGALFGAAPFDWAGTAQLSGKLFQRGLGGAMMMGTRTPWCRTSGAVKACGAQAELALGPRFRFEHWELAVLGLGRATFVTVGGSDPQVPPTTHTVWAAAAVAQVGVWPWRLGSFDFGFAASGTVWFRPFDFTVRGAALYRQPTFELVLGPTVEFAP